MTNNIQPTLQNHLGVLKKFSFVLTSNIMDAEDLYQDTIIRVVLNAHKYEANTNFKAWAFTIMRNIFINNYRKRSRRKLIRDHSNNHYYINKGVDLIKNKGESNLAYQELLNMVNQLAENFRVPFWMAFQGYQYDEIGEVLSIPLGTVKSRIYFARKKLQKMYHSEHLVLDKQEKLFLISSFQQN